MLLLRCQCLNFQMAFKMCWCNNSVTQKLKEMTFKQNLVREKHLNKQSVCSKSLQKLRNVYQTARQHTPE